jgi:hypothetical protein
VVETKPGNEHGQPAPEKPMPIPTMAVSSAEPSRNCVGDIRRLKAIAQPPSEIDKHGMNVLWPFGIRILFHEPRFERCQLVDGRSERNAI